MEGKEGLQNVRGGYLVPILSGLLFACSSPHHQPTGENIENLLNQGQYSEAEALVRSGNWKNPQPALKRISDAKTCGAALKPCGREKLDGQEIQACVLSIKSDCEGHYTTKKQQQAAADLYNKLNEAHAANEASTSDECSKEMKWGYWLYKYSRPGIINGREFFGKFSERADCEEAFLTDKRGKESGCALVYVGERKEKSIYEISAMAVMDAETKSFTLRFGSEERCQHAVKNGFTYHERDASAVLSQPPFIKYEFGPVGSKGNQRIVGSCKRVDVTVCQKHEPLPNIGEVL